MLSTDPADGWLGPCPGWRGKALARREGSRRRESCVSLHGALELGQLGGGEEGRWGLRALGVFLAVELGDGGEGLNTV